MTREPLQARATPALSREMKLLLAVLGLAALVAGWFLLSNRNAAVDEPTPPVTAVTPAESSSGSSNTEPSTVTPEPGAGGDSGATTVTPAPGSGGVDTVVAPPLPGEGAAAGNDATVPGNPNATRPPTPAGINPDTELSRVPAQNPFKPLRVEASANSGSTTATPSIPASTPVPSAVSPVSTGALGISPIPGAQVNATSTVRAPTTITAVRTPTSTATSTSGGLAFPAIPGSVRPTVTAIPSTGVVAGVPGTNTPGATITLPGSVPSTTPVAPPPVAGVSTPRPSSLPVPTPPTPTNDGTTPAEANTPEVITDLGGGSATAPAVVSALETELQSRSLQLNGVVLGPQSTAIFKGKDGFTVVSVGQTLPDSKIVLKEVTADGVTVTLGEETKTLELDKR